MKFSLRALLLIVMLALCFNSAWAAVSCSSIDKSFNDADQTTYTTASHTPGANALVILIITNTHGTSATAISSVTGNSLTWHVQDTVTNGSTRRTSLVYSMGASPTAGAQTVGFSSITQTKFIWEWVECTGTDTTGTDGSGAILQTITGSCSSCTNPFTLTFANALRSGSASFGGASINSNAVIPAGANYTSLGTSGSSTAPAAANQVEWKAAAQTTVDWQPTSGNVEGIGLEVGAPVTSAAPAIFLLSQSAQ